MVKERIGYRRLYNVVDCSISPRDEVHTSFLLDKTFQIEIHIGTKPRFGISIENNDDNYLHNNSENNRNAPTYFSNATESNYTKTFFTEICCFEDIEIDTTLSEAFRRKEPKAREDLINIAKKHLDQYRHIIDLIAGTVGLRFHRQFIKEKINENLVVLRDLGYSIEITSASLERLKDVKLSDIGIRQMETFSGLLVDSDRGNALERQRQGVILGWLLRSWTEQDNISKFNALFIALEMLLDGIKGEISENRKKLIADMRTLISTQGGEQQITLSKFFNELVDNQRPSLPSRFKILAERAKFPTKTSDIQAFGRFTKFRNDLIHQGKENVQLSIPNTNMDDKDLLALEDIVERYISYQVYGDANIYQSHWRTKPLEISHIRLRMTMDIE